MKYFTALFLVILLSQAALSQDTSENIIQGLRIVDSILAADAKIDFYSIERVEQIAFPIRNIPEHVFHLGISQLRDTIIALFSIENQYENKILTAIFNDYMSDDDHSEQNRMQSPFIVETAKDTLFGKSYFSKQNTADDIYIQSLGGFWPSKLYFSNGKPLEYGTAFGIKFFKLAADSTKVVIFAEGAKVINGNNGYGFHGPMPRETPVKASSIEEYTLLLYIADKLGDKSLLPLKLPKGK